jgi:uncharacterized phiE125 gp8 family phage protein
MSYYSVSRLTKPSKSSITLTEAKDFLKIDHDEEDIFLEKIIKAVIEQFESYTSTSLINHMCVVTYRQFIGETVTLPITPTRMIKRIQLIDFQNNVKEYDIKNCELNSDIDEVFFKVIPFSYLLRIEYIAGHGYETINVPESIKAAMLPHIAYFYENRSTYVQFPLTSYDQFRKMRF